jgi:hypothetical protein
MAGKLNRCSSFCNDLKHNQKKDEPFGLIFEIEKPNVELKNG